MPSYLSWVYFSRINNQLYEQPRSNYKRLMLLPIIVNRKLTTPLHESISQPLTKYYLPLIFENLAKVGT